MAEKYQQKYLGYDRSKTTAMLRVTMPDGSKWDVPLQAVADSRDEHYVEDKEDTVTSLRKGDIGEYDVKDWARNDMNWDDVSKFASKVAEGEPVDYQEGWVNGDMKVVGKV